MQNGVMPVYVYNIDYSNASYIKWTWLGHVWYVERIEMNACDIMND